MLLALALTACVDRLELLGPADAALPEDAGPLLVPAASLNVGNDLGCATRSNGALYCFGNNVAGQLGVGDTLQRVGPTFVDAGERWARVAVGDLHVCALSTTGVTYCWGQNTSGELGTGDTAAHARPAKAIGNYRALSSGSGYSCALGPEGAAFCWGANAEGQLGQTDGVSSPSPTPLRVGTGTYRQLAAGQGHACGISVDGGLECWGRNSEGQLGTGSMLGNQRGPTPTLSGPWTSVTATQGSTCAIRGDETLWCWGEGPGLATRSPVQIGTASDWTQVSVNEFHTCGRRGADLYCWGRGIEGQLGLGDSNPQLAPTQVPGSWLTVAASRFHTCGIQSDGRLYCWGKNDADQLGLGDDMRRYVPTVVKLP